MRLQPLLLVAAVAGGAAVTFAAPAMASNLIVNGSFEAVAFNRNGDGTTLGITDADVPGWHLPASDGVYPWGLENANIYNAGPAADGNQWIVLGEVFTAKDYTIQQTVNGLISGQTYNLTFDIASELGCCAVGEVSILSGSSTAAQDYTAPDSGAYWQHWGAHSYSFLATASSVTIQFKDLAVEFPGGNDLGLDNVQLLTGGVPEPSAWALMLVGFGALGVAMRSRGKRAAAV